MERMRTASGLLGLAALATLAALAAPAAAAPAAGAPLLGPWAGVLEGGETHEHVYDNNPADQPCVEIIAPYVATLTYEPATANVTFVVDGEEVPAANGSAVHTFEASYCDTFPVEIAAGTGEVAVAYGADVERSSPLLAGLDPAP